MLLGVPLIELLATSHRALFIAVAERVARWRARLRRGKPRAASTTIDIRRLFAAWDTLRGGGWRRALLGAAYNTGFDVLTLFFLFVALGHVVSPGVLLAGYGLPMLLGRISILPGGLGVVEGTMVALYHGLGVPTAVTVVVVLAYRLLSFWIPTLIGYPLVAYLQHRIGTAAVERAELVGHHRQSDPSASDPPTTAQEGLDELR